MDPACRLSLCQKTLVLYSAGWPQYVAGDQPDTMLAAADAALYANKRAVQSPVLPAAVLA